MNTIVKNILLATFILSIFLECSGGYNLNDNIPAKYDHLFRFRRQSPVLLCKGQVLKFQCATTSDCISAELECDGKEDCPDGSDEKESLCKDFPKKCRTPAKPDHGHWINLINDKNDYFSSQIDESSVIKYWCNPGYKLSTTGIEDSLLVHCLPNGQWNLPVLPVCQKLCPSIYNSPLITLSCKNEGSSVRCDKATDNTIVTYTCAQHYEAPYGRPKSSTCYDGFWDYIPDCIPVCGEKRVSALPLIVNGHEVERGHYPWAVALYSRKDSDPHFRNICGGSLLSTDVVVTAAHCVSQKETGNKYDAKYFRVGAGKYYIHYDDTRDADTAQYAEVALIEAYREYKGEIQNFRGDIALLKLKTNLVLSKVVQPVCYHNLPIIEPNTFGVVTGWGYTSSTGEPSETLKELELPYNADEQCSKDLDKDFSNRYFTSDKLCAGFNDQNTSVCNGDSGGGLVFRNPSFKRRYFIHGIVSLAHSYKENQRTHCNIQRNALFTKVETYVEWIQLKVRHWTRITNNTYSELNWFTTPSPNRLRGLFDEPTYRSPYKPSSITISRGPSQGCGVAGSTLILGGTDILSEEMFPWLTAMFVVLDAGYVYKCTANLVSEKHVLTAARCINNYKVQIVPAEHILFVFGKIDLRKWASSGAVTREARKIQTHPEFDQASGHGDVSIITLDRPLEFSNTISPICLWAGNNDLSEIVGMTGIVAGWRVDKVAEEADPKSVSDPNSVSVGKYLDIPIVSNEECLDSNLTYYSLTSDKTFCAGKRDGMGTCVGDSGSAFMIVKEGKYYLRGLTSRFLINSDGKCDLNNFMIFCDVAKYSTWIETYMKG